MFEGKEQIDGGVIYFFIVLLDLEVGKDCVAGVRIGHYFFTSVDESFLMQLLEDIPDWLHKAGIHSFIVVFEVDPPSKATCHLLPLTWIPHHYPSTSVVVLLYSHLVDLLLAANLQLLVNLVLDWQPVAVPPETTTNKVPSLRRISADHVFDGSRSDVAVVRSPSGERRAVVKRIGRKMLGFPELLLEGICLLPILENGFLLLR